MALIRTYSSLNFFLLVVSVILTVCKTFSPEEDEFISCQFPENFLFGVSTTAYQIEGGWNADGKGKSIWDQFTHKTLKHTLDRENGDITCDSYHKFREDVALLRNLGVNFYRFSLSWTRILPSGFPHKINYYGVRYYNELINLLIENNIKPMVTLFDYDTPQSIEELGGFTNAFVIEWFEEYAKIAFENFGDRVKLWVTFNDPKKMCVQGYGLDKMAPGYNSTGVSDYLCGHNVLRAHARVYHMYNEIYKFLQKGQISIIIETDWYEPASDSPEDVDATERAIAFSFSWYTDPIYHTGGDYPQLMKESVNKRSYLENFPKSRLPEFTEDELQYIKGTSDYFTLNHFTTQIVKDVVDDPIGDPGYNKDLGIAIYDSRAIENDLSSNKVVTLGFQKLLKLVKDKYGNPEIIITGNGFSDDGRLDDQQRIRYHKAYLKALLDAMHRDNVNIIGYAVWSLMDGFDWKGGYSSRFGLFQVNFSDPNRTRTAKASAEFYKTLIAKRSLNAENTAHNAVIIDKKLYLGFVFIFLSVFMF